MIPYLLMYLFPAVFSLEERPGTGGRRRAIAGALLFFVLFVLMIGFRSHVGGDWETYDQMIRTLGQMSFGDAMDFTDPAFAVIGRLSNEVGAGQILANFLCGLVFCIGLFVFCWQQPRPWLTLVIAIPYLVIVVGMGYVRQSAAIGCVLLGLVSLRRGSIVRFFFWCVLGGLFHFTAVIIAPFAALAKYRQRIYLMLPLIIFTAALAVYLLSSRYDVLMSGYIGAQYQSTGTLIRLVLDVIPAVLFLLLRDRFALHGDERAFWTLMSALAVALMIAYQLSPSSTAVDRIALYWIPLQLFVLARLPDALASRMGSARVWVIAVVALYLAVLIYWLVFAATAFKWVPYNSVLIGSGGETVLSAPDPTDPQQ